MISPTQLPNGPIGLAIAVIEQGAKDARKGDPDAIEWLEGKTFERLCDLLGANPDYIRYRLSGQYTPRPPKPKRVRRQPRRKTNQRRTFTADELALARQMRDEGIPYERIAEALQTSTTKIYTTLAG